MKPRIAIQGAGVMGRTLALWLSHKGFPVTLFEKKSQEDETSASFVAAGMLSPFCERETCEKEITELGQRSLDLWPQFLNLIDEEIFFSQKGSLVVAHAGDEQELHRLFRKVSEHGKILEGDDLFGCEPELDGRFRKALFFSTEAQIDTQSYMRKIIPALQKRGVVIKWNATQSADFDFQIDCRGLSAREDLPDLRGVRGELLWLRSTEVKLSRPVRLMHPRSPIYIVPRPDNIFVVGATLIESESDKDITLRSASELLSSAFSVQSGFAEAEIVATATQLRPAFPDNLPRIAFGKEIRINGLYRHGYLLAPALSEKISEYLEKECV